MKKVKHLVFAILFVTSSGAFGSSCALSSDSAAKLKLNDLETTVSKFQHFELCPKKIQVGPLPVTFSYFDLDGFLKTRVLKPNSMLMTDELASHSGGSTFRRVADFVLRRQTLDTVNASSRGGDEGRLPHGELLLGPKGITFPGNLQAAPIARVKLTATVPGGGILFDRTNAAPQIEISKEYLKPSSEYQLDVVTNTEVSVSKRFKVIGGRLEERIGRQLKDIESTEEISQAIKTILRAAVYDRAGAFWNRDNELRTLE